MRTRHFQKIERSEVTVLDRWSIKVTNLENADDEEEEDEDEEDEQIKHDEAEWGKKREKYVMLIHVKSMVFFLPSQVWQHSLQHHQQLLLHRSGQYCFGGRKREGAQNFWAFCEAPTL